MAVFIILLGFQQTSLLLSRQPDELLLPGLVVAVFIPRPSSCTACTVHNSVDQLGVLPADWWRWAGGRDHQVTA
jgi:hypothetical protein